MARLVGVVCALLAAGVTVIAAAETEAHSSYIVHVAEEHAPRSSHPRLLSRAYTSFLRDNLPASISQPAPRLLYSYAHAATDFAARLTKRQGVPVLCHRCRAIAIHRIRGKPTSTARPASSLTSRWDPPIPPPSLCIFLLRTPTPDAGAFGGTVVGPTPSSPRMASFSSRSPNRRAPEILKPDVTAPGVDILAAWTGENSPSQLASDPRRVRYNVISGTSMSCPHVSGIAALLRQAHPDWSPAAVKSALMTTAYNVDNAGDIIKDMSTGKASTPFVRGSAGPGTWTPTAPWTQASYRAAARHIHLLCNFKSALTTTAYVLDNAGNDMSTGKASTPSARGSGHVDPNRALDPGLVYLYDTDADDYFSFLCALGYTAEQIAILTCIYDEETDCSTHTASAGDLNYPAFSAVFGPSMDKVTQRRTVRNVGCNFRATYTANITSPAGVHVTVKPRKLQFDARQRTREYEITFAASRLREPGT
ncbi:unnamed protein product [Urochloa decumbens]|uniref:Uncharacterized protein n=1 Tax=Urochloa decumbens TaxID=240449 RepID=A0ABC8ZUY8_9POAL